MEDTLKIMLNEPVKLKLLDGKEYKFSALAFPDALKLADKLSLIDLVPAISIMNKDSRETLLDILETIFSYHHPDITKERLKTEKIVDLSDIRRIIDIALDLNQLKK